jgi:hypothetical protein
MPSGEQVFRNGFVALWEKEASVEFLHGIVVLRRLLHKGPIDVVQE